MTDESSSYRTTGQHYRGHQKLNQRVSEYGRRDKTGHWHTNTVEDFFSIFKRGIIGVYHHVSEAHLSRYAAEFDFRYNHRSATDGERADPPYPASAASGCRGGGLTHSPPDINGGGERDRKAQKAMDRHVTSEGEV